MSNSSQARRNRRSSAPKADRRPRGEIDRNFFFGDLLIKTGIATMVAMALIAAYTPFTLADALAEGRYEYLGVMIGFGALGFIAFLFGRHLRREATHWDFD